jgi:hypothetical protein
MKHWKCSGFIAATLYYRDAENVYAPLVMVPIWSRKRTLAGYIQFIIMDRLLPTSVFIRQSFTKIIGQVLPCRYYPYKNLLQRVWGRVVERRKLMGKRVEGGGGIIPPLSWHDPPTLGPIYTRSPGRENTTPYGPTWNYTILTRNPSSPCPPPPR